MVARIAAFVVMGSVALASAGCAIQPAEADEETISSDDGSGQDTVGTTEDPIWGARAGGFYRGGMGYGYGRAVGYRSGYAYRGAWGGGYGMYW